MSEVLTPIERRIYNYLVDYLKRETFQPSIREIGTRFGIRSTKTVTEHLQSLQRKGYLDRTPSRSRALKILGLNLSPDTYTIPLYRSETAEDDVEARFDIDRSLACSADCFMVRVNGDFREHGIFQGDLILVEPSAEAQDSNVSVYDRDGVIELRGGANGGFQPNPGTGPKPNGGRGDSASRFIGAVRAVLRVFPRD
jgi:repressor LexA